MRSINGGQFWYKWSGIITRSVIQKEETVKIRGVPDQHFQNPAGTGFTGSLRGISGRNIRP